MSPVIVHRRVNFSETDMAGVMHFSNYLRWAEDAEHALWRSLGMSVHPPAGSTAHATAATGDEISWPRVAVECAYESPLRFEEEVELRVQVESIGRKSVKFVVEFWRAGRRAARATTTAVCCRIGSGTFESIEIPEAVRAGLNAIAASAKPARPPGTANGPC